MVHEQKGLKSITIIFTIRGHSYMECDQNMALVNQRLVAEMPKDWTEHLQIHANPCKSISFRNRRLRPIKV